jgi:hypothetical protein
LFESSTIDESVELVDVDMMLATIVEKWLIVAFVVVVGCIKVQLLGNEVLSRVCFLELGHFGLITPVFWLIDEAQKTELMGYHPSCLQKNPAFLLSRQGLKAKR